MHGHEGWMEEKRSVYLYRILADSEAETERQELFAKLAEAADQQATLWAKEIVGGGGTVPATYKPDFRTWLVGSLAQRLGARAMRNVLTAMKVRGMSVYSPGPVGHATPMNLADVGRRHKAFGDGGNLRAAVFGINDGLVSNTSLITGVAGATADNAMILLTGVAGLLAGSFSMASGEYVSVRSQRDLHEYQIGLERQELETYPEEEAAELTLIYEAKGLQKDEAQRLASTLTADPERALDVLAREELGLNPEELGSPWGAAASSFLSFALGAAIPLAPFLVLSGTKGLSFAVVLSGLALFMVGSVISLFTGKHGILGGVRMMVIGGAAAGATFLIGKAIGVSLG